jgi:hypothetical protein
LSGLRGATLVNHVALEDGGGAAHLQGLRVALQDRAPLDARVDLSLSALALGQLGDQEGGEYPLLLLGGGALVLDLPIIFLVVGLRGERQRVLLELVCEAACVRLFREDRETAPGAL